MSVDYYPCDVCGKDLIWDSGWMLKAVEVIGNGDIKALCEECAKTHRIVIDSENPPQKELPGTS